MVRINHVYRERNRIANWLTNLALSLPMGSHLLDRPPSRIVGLLLFEDISGICLSQDVRLQLSFLFCTGFHPPIDKKIKIMTLLNKTLAPFSYI